MANLSIQEIENAVFTEIGKQYSERVKTSHAPIDKSRPFWEIRSHHVTIDIVQDREQAHRIFNNLSYGVRELFQHSGGTKCYLAMKLS